MGLSQPLVKLHAHLLGRGLPAAYVGRTVQELADHHADLVEGAACEQADGADQAWQKLGDVERLGDELVRKYRARSFAGRHPLLTFVAAPLPLVVTLWAATFFAGWAAVFNVAELLGNALEQRAPTDWVAGTWPLPTWLVLTVHYAIEALPPAVCAWWFCRLASRSGRELRWAVVACGLIVLLSCLVYSDLRMPGEGKHAGMMLLVLRLPLYFQQDWQLLQSRGLWHCLAVQFAHFQRQAPQVLAPLAVLAFAVWRARRLGEIPLTFGERAVAS